MNHYISSILLFLTLTSLSTPNTYKVQTKWLTDSKGKKMRKASETQWNMQGDVVRYVEYTEGMKPFVQEFSFEYQAGHKVKMTNLGNHEFTVFNYDKVGRPIQELRCTANKKLYEKLIHTYKGTRKNVCYTDLFEAGKQAPLMRTTFEYYPNGLLKKEVRTVDGGWFQTREMKYDSSKNLVYESEQAQGGVGVVRYHYTYEGDTLVKDVVKVPDTGAEYHIYDTKWQ
jgi:hypothetical protein